MSDSWKKCDKLETNGRRKGKIVGNIDPRSRTKTHRVPNLRVFEISWHV